IHAASAGERGIGGVSHGIHRDPGDVAFLQNDFSPIRASPVHTYLYYNHFMTRRELLAAGAVFATCATTLMGAKTHLDKSRISAITDEIGLSTLEAIAFAHHYEMQNVEIRNSPGKKEYYLLPESEIKADAD